MFVEMDDMLVLWNMDTQQPMSVTPAMTGSNTKIHLYRREGWDGELTRALPPRNANTNMYGYHETAQYVRQAGYTSGLPKTVTISGQWWVGPDYWVGSQQEFRSIGPPELHAKIAAAAASIKPSIASLKAAASQGPAFVKAFEATGWARLGMVARAAGGPQSVLFGAYALYHWTYFETVYEVKGYVKGTTNDHLRNLIDGPQPE